MYQVYKPIKYLLIGKFLCTGQASRFCHLEKPAAFEVSPGIVFGGNCPLGFISVTACCCQSRGWMTFGNVLFLLLSVAQFLSVWTQVETLL